MKIKNIILFFACIACAAGIAACSDDEDVPAPASAPEVFLDRSELVLKSGQTERLSADVSPDDPEYGDIAWGSDDLDVAMVDETGLITAFAPGEAVITASVGGATACCRVSVVLPDPLVGDYYYEDGTWSAKPDPSKKAVGVIFWLGDPACHDEVLRADHPECTHGLVVSLGEHATPWQGNFMDCEEPVGDWIAANTDYPTVVSGYSISDDLNKMVGYRNTRAMEAYNAHSDNGGWQVDAVNQAVSYRETVVLPEGTSGWYLPSPKELSLLCIGDYDGTIWSVDMYEEPDPAVREAVNYKLETIGATPLSSSDYWASLEEDLYLAFIVSFRCGAVYSEYKDDGYFHTRYVFAF